VKTIALRQERDILAKAAAWFVRERQGEPERVDEREVTLHRAQSTHSSEPQQIIAKGGFRSLENSFGVRTESGI
jgi:hypothetical protein